jgi:hypothetical protein
VHAVLALRRALLRLADAVVPAQLALFEKAWGVGATGLLHVAARLGVADALAAGPRRAEELAAELGVDADALHRTLRALAGGGVFALDAEGRFSNTRLSQVLRRGSAGSMRDFVEYVGSAANVRAWADVLETVRTGKNAFSRVHGQDVWAWLAAHPEEERVFADAMVALTREDAPAVARAYPFGRHRRVCDVAGGRGTLLAEVLGQHPALTGVLFDAPQVVARAEALLQARGLSGRVERVGGDLFGGVPAGCDAYLLKDVLHDWDDAACLRILTGVRQACAPGGRLLVVEVLVEPNDARPPGPAIDVQMMVVCREGRQRSREDLARLLQGCGFALVQVHPTARAVSVVEARAV